MLCVGSGACRMPTTKRLTLQIRRLTQAIVLETDHLAVVRFPEVRTSRSRRRRAYGVGIIQQVVQRWLRLYCRICHLILVVVRPRFRGKAPEESGHFLLFDFSAFGVSVSLLACAISRGSGTAVAASSRLMLGKALFMVLDTGRLT
jgi:hypothetical protein